MDSRLKVAGHAVHPMLIPLPLGMFAALRGVLAAKAATLVGQETASA